MFFRLFLFDAALRGTIFASTVVLLLWLFRVKSPATRHAALAIAMSAMLVVGFIPPLLPPIPVAVPALPSTPASLTLPASSPQASPVPQLSPKNSWDFALAVYLVVGAALLLRLLYGYILTRRLIASSESAGAYRFSQGISTPATVGWLRPVILLPYSAREWPESTLEAVLAHERAHIKRVDWLISILAAINRSVFWFNPISWWIERKLSTLAELACDDAVLLQAFDREQYAATLLDMAALKSESRNLGSTIPMAKPSEIRHRIERILDERPNLRFPLARTTKTILCVAGVAGILLTASARRAPAQEGQRSTLSSNFHTWRARALPPGEAAVLESAVARNPEDIPSRTRLIFHYLVVGQNELRASHVLWMIEHHPEAEVHQSMTLFGAPGPLQDISSYTRAAQLWQQQASRHATNPAVVLNAVRFLHSYFYFYERNGEQAEYWIHRALSLGPDREHWLSILASYYTQALWDAERTRAANTFAQHARSKLDRSTDAFLIGNVGRNILGYSAPVANPALAEFASYGRHLLARAAALGYIAPPIFHPGDSAQSEKRRRESLDGPQPRVQVQPEYPALARQARLQGAVRLRALVDRNGSVSQIEIIDGHPLLIGAAREAVRQWRYDPQPIEALVEIEVPFRL